MLFQGDHNKPLQLRSTENMRKRLEIAAAKGCSVIFMMNFRLLSDITFVNHTQTMKDRKSDKFQRTRTRYEYKKISFLRRPLPFITSIFRLLICSHVYATFDRCTYQQRKLTYKHAGGGIQVAGSLWISLQGPREESSLLGC